MRGKIALFSVALLSVALLALATFSTPVMASSTKTIDGNPSDWTGTPGATNTFVISQGEGIWNDAAMDDTGNGSVTYPNGTMSPPGWGGYGIVNDSAGGPDGYAYYYTEQFTGTTNEPTWQGHGGMVDLREVRITADSANLYMMFRIENMGNTAIACQWISGNYLSVPLNPYANATKIGKIMLQVFIDEDRVYGSGRTNTTRNGNFLIDPSAAWEALVSITGDLHAPGRETPDVVLADGTRILLNSTTYMMGDSDIYPACIEVKVPFTALGPMGNPLGKTWRFTVVMGGSDDNWYRVVANATWAQANGWPLGSFFYPGENMPPWAINATLGLAGGQGPNVIDMAFTPDQATQEAMLNNYTRAPGTGLAVLKAYQDITFSASGPVGGEAGIVNTLLLMAPYIILGAAVAATAISVVVYGRKRPI